MYRPSLKRYCMRTSLTSKWFPPCSTISPQLVSGSRWNRPRYRGGGVITDTSKGRSPVGRRRPSRKTVMSPLPFWRMGFSGGILFELSSLSPFSSDAFIVDRFSVGKIARLAAQGIIREFFDSSPTELTVFMVLLWAAGVTAAKQRHLGRFMSRDKFCKVNRGEYIPSTEY